MRSRHFGRKLISARGLQPENKMIMKNIVLRSLLLSLAGLAVTSAVTFAQEAAGVPPQVNRLAEQNLRAYWHVFAAYALVILMSGGWVISIARRLRAIEDRGVE